MNQYARRHLVRKLQQTYDKMICTLAEAAAAYQGANKPVPSWVGESLGAVQRNKQSLARIEQIFIDGNRGPGTDKLIRRYLAETADVGLPSLEDYL